MIGIDVAIVLLLVVIVPTCIRSYRRDIERQRIKRQVLGAATVKTIRQAKRQERNLVRGLR